MLPIFEKTQSPLVRSNDGRLMIFTDPIERGRPIEYVVNYSSLGDPGIDSPEVFRTFDRIKCDSFVAGYDLAAEKYGADLKEARELVREYGGSRGGAILE